MPAVASATAFTTLAVFTAFATFPAFPALSFAVVAARTSMRDIGHERDRR